MAFTIIVGYVFDMFGRRITIVSSVLLGATALFFVPLTAPVVYPWLIIVRILISIAFLAANG
jgi:MFS family permease